MAKVMVCRLRGWVINGLAPSPPWSLGSFAVGEASCLGVRTPKQPDGEARTGRPRGPPSTANTNYVSEPRWKSILQPTSSLQSTAAQQRVTRHPKTHHSAKLLPNAWPIVTDYCCFKPPKVWVMCYSVLGN